MDHDMMEFLVLINIFFKQKKINPSKQIKSDFIKNKFKIQKIVWRIYYKSLKKLKLFPAIHFLYKFIYISMETSKTLA